MTTRAIDLPALLAIGLLAGCKADVPEGKIACRNDDECPAHWSCRDDGAGRRCYSAPLDDDESADADAGAGHPAARDGGGGGAGQAERDAGSSSGRDSGTDRRDAGGLDASDPTGTPDAAASDSGEATDAEVCLGVPCGEACCPADGACHEGECTECATPPADFGDSCECEGTIGCDGSCVGRPPALGVECGCGGEIVCSGECSMPMCPAPTVGGTFTEGGTMHDAGPAYTLGKNYERLTITGMLPVAGQLTFWVLLPAHAPNMYCGDQAVVALWIRMSGVIQNGFGASNYGSTEAVWHQVGPILLEPGAYDISAEAGEGDGCGYPETSDPVYLSDIVLEPR